MFEGIRTKCNFEKREYGSLVNYFWGKKGTWLLREPGTPGCASLFNELDSKYLKTMCGLKSYPAE